MDLDQALQAGLSKVTGWVEGVVRNLPEILAAGVLVVLALVLARLAKNIGSRVMDRVTDHGPLKSLAAQTFYVIVLVAGFFAALAILELDTVVTSLLAGVGILGLALGFAFQDIAQNFISGILITLRRPFTDGDLVETNGFLGKVEGVDLRATRVRALTGQLVRIPNSSVYGEPLTNYSQATGRRLDLACGTSYGDDLEKARDVALEAMHEVEGRDPDRDPEVFFTEFGGSSIDFVARVWLKSTSQRDFLASQSDAIVRLKKAFDENEVGIPFPIVTLDFSDAGTRRLDEPLQLLRSVPSSD